LFKTVLAVAMPFLLAALLLTACNAKAQDAESPVAKALEPFLPALKADSFDELVKTSTAPRYTLDVEVNVISRTLEGRGQIRVRNNSREPWNQIFFRLYPNLDYYGGDMAIHSVTLDGSPTNFTMQDERTSLRVLLPRPLLPREEVTVGLAWGLTYPSWVDDHLVYALFGRSQKMTSLPLFYPSLAVYDQGASVGSGAWWREVGTVRGDAAFNEISLFDVTARLPSDQVPVTSGTLVMSNTIGGGQTQYNWVTGPSREFLLHMSPLFESETEVAYGTRVTSYWLPDDESAGLGALQYAVASLRAYSDLYGEYPFSDMRVAPAPLGFRGMEYPQAMLLGVDLYDRQRPNLEVLVAHEMAHQWWYQMVHNDPVNTPWLDEGIAEYSVRLYTEELRGDSKAEALQYQRWEAPLEILRKRGNDVQVNGTVASFKSGNQYEAVVYGKGALFFDALRKDLGNRKFLRFLQTYLNGHKWGLVSDDDFLAALHVVGNSELIRLFEEWVGEEAMQATQPDAATGN
jgi:hypothetical protein